MTDNEPKRPYYQPKPRADERGESAAACAATDQPTIGSQQPTVGSQPTVSSQRTVQAPQPTQVAGTPPAAQRSGSAPADRTSRLRHRAVGVKRVTQAPPPPPPANPFHAQSDARPLAKQAARPQTHFVQRFEESCSLWDWRCGAAGLLAVRVAWWATFRLLRRCLRPTNWNSAPRSCLPAARFTIAMATCCMSCSIRKAAAAPLCRSTRFRRG